LLLGERAFRDTEFVVDGHNGYLYSGPEDFAEKADLIFKDLDKFRNSSRQLAVDRFSYKTNFIDFYNDLYQKT